MVITSKKIRKIIKQYEPKLEFIVLSDPEWLPWGEGELDEWIANNMVNFAIPKAFECEEHTIRMVSEQRYQWAKRIIDENFILDQRKNKAMGMVWGTKFNGVMKNHFLVVAFTKDKMFLVEPQTGKRWEYDDDKILFLFM